RSQLKRFGLRREGTRRVGGKREGAKGKRSDSPRQTASTRSRGRWAWAESGSELLVGMRRIGFAQPLNHVHALAKLEPVLRISLVELGRGPIVAFLGDAPH